MTFTYDMDGSDLSRVRFALGDTTTPNHLLEDEEISLLLADGDAPSVVAYKCARSLAARFAREADFAMDEQSVKLSQKSAQFERLAERLEASSVDGGLQSIVFTKIDGYQPVGTEKDANDRSHRVVEDFDAGRFNP